MRLSTRLVVATITLSGISSFSGATTDSNGKDYWCWVQTEARVALGTREPVIQVANSVNRQLSLKNNGGEYYLWDITKPPHVLLGTCGSIGLMCDNGDDGHFGGAFVRDLSKNSFTMDSITGSDAGVFYRELAAGSCAEM